MYNKIVNKSGSSIRRMRRNLCPDAFTRNQAIAILSKTGDTNICKVFEKHQNHHVRNRAISRAQSIMDNIARREIASRPEIIVTKNDDFDALVARFKAEGKRDPEKSARASINMRKLNAKRVTKVA